MRHSKSHAKPKADLPPLSPELDARDRDAFERAIAMMRQSSPMDAAQIDGKLAHEGFESAGKFASYSMQCDTLRLRPWQSPPCTARGEYPADAYGHRPAEIGLRDRLLAAGLSKYEPDPIAALARLGAA
jgi:hypothetical protein